MAAKQAAAFSGPQPQPAPKPWLKEMPLTDRLRQHWHIGLGDCLHSDLLNDEPEHSKVLLTPRSRGRQVEFLSHEKSLERIVEVVTRRRLLFHFPIPSRVAKRSTEILDFNF